jgi:hypothetical protein
MPAHSSWRSSRRATWRRLYVARLSGVGACCIARNRCRSPRGDDANVWTAVLYVGGYDVQWRVGACVVVCVRPGATAIRLSETWPHRRPLSIVAHADHNDRRTKHRVSFAASAALRTIRCGRRDGLCNPYLLLGCRQSWASYRASSSWAPGGAAAVPRRSAVGCRGSLSPAGTWRRLPAG